MPSATEAAKERSKGSSNLLRASDLPAKTRELTVKVKEARKAPDGFGSPLILDLDGEVVPGKSAIPLNITNTRALAELLGDDYSEWEGASVTVTRVPTRNPQDGTNTWGLRVVDARRRLPSRSAKPVTKDKAKKSEKDNKDNEVPF